MKKKKGTEAHVERLSKPGARIMVEKGTSPSLGSTKSTPSMKTASGAGCLCTRGSSIDWRPNSDAKGIYIRGNGSGRGRRWGIKGSDENKGSENKSG